MSQPNVLFIVMDTARARNALPSENPSVVPSLAELADDGVEFTAAVSSAPWTLPSHASLFTGQYTSQHGTNAGDKLFDPDHATLPELLRRAGYETIAFSNNSWVSPEFGFDRGFDQFRPGWKLFDVDGNLTQAMREYDDAVDQIRALFDSTGLRSLPGTLANAAYTKFVRKSYDYGARITNWRIGRWLKRRERDQPFFAFVNYLEPHLEYDPPDEYCEYLPADMDVSTAKRIKQDPWRFVAGELELTGREFEALEGLYDSELSYLDYRIGRLLEGLADQGVLEDTVVVVVGDHGENIGDHGLMDHQYCLYDTLIHVPLLIRGVDNFRGGRTVTEVVETRRLFPTVLDIAGVEGPDIDSVADQSLSSTIDGSSERREDAEAIAEYLVPQPDLKKLEQMVGQLDESVAQQCDRAIRAIRTARWKYIEYTDGTEELYDLDTDPHETSDVSSERSEVRRRLHQRLQDRCGPLRQGSQASETVDAGAQQRLEDLGYI